MHKELKWNCPGLDTHFLPDQVCEMDFSVLSCPRDLLKIIPMITEFNQEEVYILPVIQNQEACILGASMSKKAGYWAPGNYPFSTQEELLHNLEEKRNGILKEDVRSKALLEVIRELKGRDIIVEIEAPFSILAALVPPEKVYASLRRRKDGCIAIILDRIIEELILYMKALTEAGCKVISLADPLGKWSLCGPQIYQNWIAPWDRKLLEKSCDYLEHALIHLCGNMAMDLIKSGFAFTERIPFDPEYTYIQNLQQIAEDPSVRYVGPGCLRNRSKTSVGYRLVLNNAEE